jgi:hypothetical protein
MNDRLYGWSGVIGFFLQQLRSRGGGTNGSICSPCRKRCRRLSRNCIKGNKKPAEAGCVTPGDLLNAHANGIGYCIATCHSGKVNGRLLSRPPCLRGDNSHRAGRGVAIIHLYIELFGKLAQYPGRTNDVGPIKTKHRVVGNCAIGNTDNATGRISWQQVCACRRSGSQTSETNILPEQLGFIGGV